MRRTVRLAGAALAVTACVKEEPPASRVSITVTDDGRHCGARTAAMSIDDLEVPGAINRIVKGIPPSGQVHLFGTSTVGDRCIGALIHELQRHGVERVAFISEPPPSDRR